MKQFVVLLAAGALCALVWASLRLLAAVQWQRQEPARQAERAAFAAAARVVEAQVVRYFRAPRAGASDDYIECRLLHPATLGRTDFNLPIQRQQGQAIRPGDRVTVYTDGVRFELKTLPPRIAALQRDTSPVGAALLTWSLSLAVFLVLAGVGLKLWRRAVQ